MPECSGVDDTITSNLSGTNYQWQEYNGSNFVNVVGQTYPQLIITASYGDQFRCIVDGDTSDVFTIKFVDTWIGTTDSTWESPVNWSCGSIPNLNMDVVINNGKVVLNSNTAVRSLTISPNASFTIDTGNNLVVTH